MRECLSKAIQWMSPDLIVGHTDASSIVARLEELLNLEWEQLYTKYGKLAEEDKLEMILIEMKNMGFEIMEECLNVLKIFVPDAINDLWKIYKQYLNTNFDKIVCLYCKIRSRVDIKHCSRYLHRRGIISGHLHKIILGRNATIGSQEDLWNELEEECNKYHTPKHIVEAINNGLHSQGDQYKFMLPDIKNWLNQENPTFKCKCQEAFSEMFMPKRYRLKTQSSAKFMDKMDKENQMPKSDQADSVNNRRKNGKKKSRGRSVPFERKFQASSEKEN